MELIVFACPHDYYLEAFKTEVEAPKNNVTIEIPDNLRNQY
jgi:hypothetical protein